MRTAPTAAGPLPAPCYSYSWTGGPEVLPVAARAWSRLEGKVPNASAVLSEVCSVISRLRMRVTAGVARLGVAV